MSKNIIGGNSAKDSNADSEECKKIMTQDIIAEIQKIYNEDKESVKKKNAEAQQRFQSQSEANFTKLQVISKDLFKALNEFAMSLNDSKCDASLKQYADMLQTQMAPLFKSLNQQIAAKSLTIQANAYIDNKTKAINKFIVDAIADLKAQSKAGCCGGGQLKKKLQSDVPRIFYSSIHLLEGMTQMQGIQGKQEFKSTDWDVDGLKMHIQQSVDKYFPTGNNVVIVEKEVVKTVTKEVQVPVEVIKYVDKIIEKQVQGPGPVEDLLCKAHEYLYGIGTPQQVKNGIQLYEKEEKKNNVKALNCLGQIYFEGKVIQQDLKKSYEYYLNSSERNDPEGQYRLGLFYERGQVNDITGKKLSTDDQMKKAVELFKKAANQKHYDAITDLGFIYESGIKSSDGNYIELQNLLVSKTYYESVDFENCPRACNNIGNLYLKLKNQKQALSFFQKADMMGYPSGSMNLGICYLKGIGVPQDINKAMDYLKKAAKKGNQEAKLQYCYNLLQHASNFDDETEYFQVATYLREILTVDPKNPEALLYLGFQHELGLGVVADFKACLKYYFLSAEQGNDRALTKLGDIYFSGTLLPRDIPRAIQYYETAADKNNTTAMNNLGAIFEEGYDGTPPDYEKAYEFYYRAAQAGSAEAWTHIGLMIEMGRKKEDSAGEGYKALLRASEMGSLNSLQILKNKINQLDSDQVQVGFNQIDDDKARILMEHSENIMSKYNKLSEEQDFNTLKAMQIAQDYDTPTRGGLEKQNFGQSIFQRN